MDSAPSQNYQEDWRLTEKRNNNIYVNCIIFLNAIIKLFFHLNSSQIALNVNLALPVNNFIYFLLDPKNEKPVCSFNTLCVNLKS